MGENEKIVLANVELWLAILPLNHVLQGDGDRILPFERLFVEHGGDERIGCSDICSGCILKKAGV